MQTMKKLFAVMVPLLLAACAGSVQELDVSTVSTDKGYLILDMDATFDGDHAKGKSFSTSCFLAATHTSELVKITGNDTTDLDVDAVGDSYHFRIASAQKPGRYAFDTVSCIAYKVLWNKVRKKYINPPLIVDIQPGTITYPGTLVIDWESAGFGGLDLINLGGGLDEDDGKLVMKRADRSAQIKSKLETENPALIKKFKFVTTTFETNPRILQ